MRILRADTLLFFTAGDEERDFMFAPSSLTTATIRDSLSIFRLEGIGCLSTCKNAIFLWRYILAFFSRVIKFFFAGHCVTASSSMCDVNAYTFGCAGPMIYCICYPPIEPQPG